MIAGVGRSRTNARGEASFYLPGDDWYAVVVTFDGHEEVLYQEMLTRGSTLVYMRDPSALPAGCWLCLPNRSLAPGTDP